MALNWFLSHRVNAVIFDCDGTLSAIEGIDFLAEQNGVGDEVKKMTADAMSKKGLTLEIFEHRLNLVKPTFQQVTELGYSYYERCVPGIKENIKILQRLKKNIFIVSAGLLPSVKIFGSLLNLPSQNIFAVDILFDTSGRYQSFDKHSPLVQNDGKKIIVTKLQRQYEELAYFGDGLNDLSVIPLVTRFIGYGGLSYREKIASQSAFYISSHSTAPLLPLTITLSESNKLLEDEKIFYETGKAEIKAGKVIIK